MAEERMSVRQHQKYEKVFFLYGSVSKMVTPVRPDEWQKLAEEMWSWAIAKVSALVDEFSDGFLEPPPDLSEVEIPANAKLITIKEKQMLKQGQNGANKWMLTKLVDQNNVSYSTFAGSRYEVGKEYPVEFEEVTRGGNTYLQIKEAK